MNHFSINKLTQHTSEQPQQSFNTSNYKCVLSADATVSLNFHFLILLCKFILISVLQSSILIKIFNIAYKETATQKINCLNKLLI